MMSCLDWSRGWSTGAIWLHKTFVLISGVWRMLPFSSVFHRFFGPRTSCPMSWNPGFYALETEICLPNMARRLLQNFFQESFQKALNFWTSSTKKKDFSGTLIHRQRPTTGRHQKTLRAEAKTSEPGGAVFQVIRRDLPSNRFLSFFFAFQVICCFGLMGLR